MDASEFRDMLSDLGLSQRSAAALLGRSLPTISNWVTGKYPIPDGVEAALNKRLGIPEPVPVVEIEAIEPEPIVPVDDALPVLTIVRRAYPHSGPWMQIQSINGDGTYLCWWQVDDARKTASYARDGLETYEEAMTANKRAMPVFGVPIVSLPLKHVA